MHSPSGLGVKCECARGPACLPAYPVQPASHRGSTSCWGAACISGLASYRGIACTVRSSSHMGPASCRGLPLIRGLPLVGDLPRCCMTKALA